MKGEADIRTIGIQHPLTKSPNTSSQSILQRGARKSVVPASLETSAGEILIHTVQAMTQIHSDVVSD
jgi:hypothetical protein